MTDLQLEQPIQKTAVMTPTNYRIQVSQQIEDANWDRFLAQTPGSHHVQTSLWAQVKAPTGWQAVRLTVRQGEQIVAGAQILIKTLFGVGSVGYVSNGPFFAKEDSELTTLVTNELKQIAKEYRIQNLIVQPPVSATKYAEELPQWGFQPSSLEMALTATTILDIDRDLDTILAQMKSKTRYNVRLSQRKGITVREGTEADIPTFHRILSATGERQGFSPDSQEYFAEMMRILSPHGYFKLFLAEYEGEAASCMLAIPFGDTIIYKRGAWAGIHGEKRPNEAMHWAAIQWAKEQGYKYYDFDGMEPPVAKLLAGEPIPNDMVQTVSRFKVGFSGDIVLRPSVYEYVYNPLIRWGYNTIYPQLSNSPKLEKMIKRLRSL